MMEILGMMGLTMVSGITMASLNIDIRRRGDPDEDEVVIPIDTEDGLHVGAAELEEGAVVDDVKDQAKTLKNEALALIIFSGASIAFAAGSAIAGIMSMAKSLMGGRVDEAGKKALNGVVTPVNRDPKTGMADDYLINVTAMLAGVALIAMVVLASLNISHENGDSCAPDLLTSDVYYWLPGIVIGFLGISFLWAWGSYERKKNSMNAAEPREMNFEDFDDGGILY